MPLMPSYTMSAGSCSVGSHSRRRLTTLEARTISSVSSSGTERSPKSAPAVAPLSRTTRAMMIGLNRLFFCVIELPFARQKLHSPAAYSSVTRFLCTNSPSGPVIPPVSQGIQDAGSKIQGRPPGRIQPVRLVHPVSCILHPDGWAGGIPVYCPREDLCSEPSACPN